jgi:glycosyltransferase involved in cell wall biosynthesis
MKIANVVLNDFTRDNRVLKISKSLVEAGHDVSVVALQGSGLPEHEVHLHQFTVNRLNWRTKALPRGMIFGGVKVVEIACRAIWGYRKFDAWHCNDIEAFLIGIFAKCLNPRLQLVYDCHEFESERNAKSGMERRLVQWLERRLIRYAQAVLVVSPSIRKAYVERYTPFGMKPPVLLRNVPHRRVEEISKNSILREKLGLSEAAFMAIYQGAFTYNRGIEQLLEMSTSMKDDGIHLVFMGYGLLENEIKSYAERFDWVHCHPAVPYEEVQEYSSSADIGLVSVKPTCLSYLYCLPNKLFEYLQAELPVMVNDLPDCRSLLDDYGAGIAVQPDTPEQWREELRSFKLNMAAVKGQMAPGLKKAQKELNWEIESEQLLHVYDAITPR